MAIITKPGIYPDISPADYFKEPCPEPALTSSTISILRAQCAAKAAYAHPAIDQPADEVAKELEKYLVGSGVGKPAQALGGVVHRLALGKGADYLVGEYDEYRSKEAKAWRDDAIEAGVIPLKQKQFDQADAMSAVIKAALDEACDGHEYMTELVIAWQEDTPHGPIWCRGMLDVYCPYLNLILDVKTAASISDDAIDGCFNRWGYALQSAYYRRGIDAILGRLGESRFDFLFVENEAPWLGRTVDTSEGFRAGSTMEIEQSIVEWGKCLATGIWPGYGRRTATPKPWTVKQWVEDGFEIESEEW